METCAPPSYPKRNQALQSMYISPQGTWLWLSRPKKERRCSRFPPVLKVRQTSISKKVNTAIHRGILCTCRLPGVLCALRWIGWVIIQLGGITAGSNIVHAPLWPSRRSVQEEGEETKHVDCKVRTTHTSLTESSNLLDSISVTHIFQTCATLRKVSIDERDRSRCWCVVCLPL